MTGGFGSGVLELARGGPPDRPGAARRRRCASLGIPGDRFVDHGSVVDLRRVLRLDAPGLADQVRETLDALGLTAGRPGLGRRLTASMTRRAGSSTTRATRLWRAAVGACSCSSQLRRRSCVFPFIDGSRARAGRRCRLFGLVVLVPGGPHGPRDARP